MNPWLIILAIGKISFWAVIAGYVAYGLLFGIGACFAKLDRGR